MTDFNLITLSHATYVGASGATAAATHAFFTSDYKPPSQERHFDSDVVHNQNGKFKYLYDNGPGFKKWAPFNIHCENQFAEILQKTAAQQLAAISALWDHPGILGMQTPEGTYTVHWAEAMDKSFRIFPLVGSAPEHVVVVQFDEAQ